MLAPLLAAAATIGSIHSYVRTNRDGSEAETIHVYRPAPDRIEVMKERDRCTNAAFVTATIDPATGQASRLTGGRLLRGAGHRDFALLTYDAASRRIDARVETPDGALANSISVTATPWHLYDFDLASLSAMTQALARPRDGFDFGLARVWLGDDPSRFLEWLGPARATFVRAERHAGRRALRFAVSGDAFGAAGGGPLWIDARDGSLLAARWGLPNHAEYRDFALTRTATAKGAAAWRKLLLAHFDGCPPA